MSQVSIRLLVDTLQTQEEVIRRQRARIQQLEQEIVALTRETRNEGTD